MKNIEFAIVIISLSLMEVQSEKTVRIIAVGDIMLGRNVAKVMKERDSETFIGVQEVLKEEDVVLGHHPHVVQPVEQYKDKIIAYSLGNFLFDVKSSRRSNGIILSIEASRSNILSYAITYLDRTNYYFPKEGVKRAIIFPGSES